MNHGGVRELEALWTWAENIRHVEWRGLGMRMLLAVSGVCGALITSALAADWQEVWNGDRKSGGTWAVSIDKESLRPMAGSKVRVSIREHFSEVQTYKGKGSFPDFEFDTTIYDWVINCDDYTSTVRRRAYYLDSTFVKDFDESAYNIPAPPQFETGVPVAMKAACS
jgi:hypothetical protein